MQREQYDYPEHSRVGAEHGQQVSDETCERFCVLGTPEQHVEKLRRLEAAGVDQWNIYLMTSGQEETLREAYGSGPRSWPRAAFLSEAFSATATRERVRGVRSRTRLVGMPGQPLGPDAALASVVADRPPEERLSSPECPPPRLSVAAPEFRVVAHASSVRATAAPSKS